ncbi:3'-5' exonuclease [Stakelama marina]|uniref:DNA polymerase III subunit epsilon n=1 Tax=Stakelama marina TaxID=2826939 RepID=A0A8T4IIQ6_9SPHN|nr:3'-5' exonuclease [Stakelama marina]MBR0553764.1 DNA polymerase III subunit epsilon [Stakelama marina]
MITDLEELERTAAWLPAETERLAAALDRHPDYRVLRSLPPLDYLPRFAPEGRERTAIVLDIETTSLDHRTGKIIEVALCPVRFDRRGRITGIGKTQSWLEDPGEPLEPAIERLTGLSDAELAGQRIDDDAVLGLLKGADVMIAHHCAFDALWIEARYPDIAGKPWACSLKDIDWAAHGVESRKLGHLLAELCGWFNARHRAAADVEALVALLASPLPGGRSGMAELLISASKPGWLVSATGAPFEVKDRLKARGYRWSPERKCWWIEVRQAALEAETDWLAADAQCRSPDIRKISWRERHR